MGLVFRLFIFIVVAGFFFFLVRYGHAQAAEPQALSPEGFPAEWNEADFNPAGSISPTSPTAAPNTPGGAPVVAGGKGVTLRVDQLPVVSPTLATSAVTIVSAALAKPSVQDEVIAGVVSETNTGLRVPALTEANLPGAPSGEAALAAYGIFTGTEGLGNNLWKDSSRTVTDPVLAALPAAGSPAQKTMLERLLLTRADAPAQSDKMPRPSWLAMRATALEKTGAGTAAFQLWRVAKDKAAPTDAATLRGWAQSMVLAGQHGAVCPLAGPQATQAVAENPASADARFWRSMVVVCQALNQQREALALSVEMLAKENAAATPHLLDSLNAVAGKTRTVTLPQNEPISPLAAAVMAAYPAIIPPGAAARLPDVIARRLLQTPGLPVGLQTGSAEVLVNAGGPADDASKLADLYATYAFSQDQLANPIGSVQQITDASMARALLYQVATNGAALPELRRAAWLAYVGHANAAGLPRLQTMVQNKDVPLNSEGAAAIWQQQMRFALLEGQNTVPLLATRNGISGTIAASATLAVAANAVAGTPVSAELWAAWLAETEAGAQSLRTALVLEALGQPLPADVLDNLAKRTPAETDAGSLLAARKLDDAPNTSRGMVVLNVLTALRGKPAWAASPLVAAAGVQALTRQNLPREARALALEAMLPPALLAGGNAVPSATTPPPAVNAVKAAPAGGRQIGGGPTTSKLPLTPPSRGVGAGAELSPPRSR